MLWQVHNQHNYHLCLQLSKVSDIIGKHGIIIGYLRSLAELHNDGEAGARCRVLAIIRRVLHMDGIDDRLVDKLNRWIRIEIGSQSASDGQQGERIDQDLEEAELQAAIGDVRIGALATIDDLLQSWKKRLV